MRVSNKDVLPAFYFALRDTLVAKDLDQATRIAYGAQRHRVVTLDGQVIEPSGTMSGGGGRVSKGRMGSRVVEDVNPREVEEMEGQLQQVRALSINIGPFRVYFFGRPFPVFFRTRLSRNLCEIARRSWMTQCSVFNAKRKTRNTTFKSSTWN